MSHGELRLDFVFWIPGNNIDNCEPVDPAEDAQGEDRLQADRAPRALAVVTG